MLDPLHVSLEQASAHLVEVKAGAAGFDWKQLIPAAIQVLTVLSMSIPNPIVKAVLGGAIAVLRTYEASATTVVGNLSMTLGGSDIT